MEEKENRKKIKRFNEWKIAFLVLLGLLIGGVLFIAVRVTENREPEIAKQSQTLKKGDTLAEISTNKSQINKLINTYLQDMQSQTLKYQFYIDSQAVLEGTYKFLGVEVPLFIYFEPFKLENGNIQLKVKSVSVGTLSLPSSAILSFVAKEYDFPKFVKVDAKNSYVELQLNQLSFGKKMYLKANRIDALNDQFIFEFYKAK